MHNLINIRKNQVLTILGNLAKAACGRATGNERTSLVLGIKRWTEQRPCPARVSRGEKGRKSKEQYTQFMLGDDVL